MKLYLLIVFDLEIMLWVLKYLFILKQLKKHVNIDKIYLLKKWPFPNKKVSGKNGIVLPWSKNLNSTELIEYSYILMCFFIQSVTMSYIT